jgi:putative ABC transport system ATP-binding protein
MISTSSLVHSYEAQRRIEFPDIKLPEGQHLLILGPSGCGKSTLLHILGGLLEPTAGDLSVCGHKFTKVPEGVRDSIRGKNIGIVFQRLYLSPSLSCLNSLRAAQYLAGIKVDEEYCQALLSRLGLGGHEQKLPRNLSHGQAQRLAIARALANRPRIVLADEPTSALDDTHAASVVNLLQEHSESCGASLVVATHDSRIRSQFKNALVLQ